MRLLCLSCCRIALGEPNLPLGGPPRPLSLRLASTRETAAAAAAAVAGDDTAAGDTAVAAAATREKAAEAAAARTAAAATPHAFLNRCSRDPAAAAAAAVATGLLPGPPGNKLETLIPLLGKP